MRWLVFACPLLLFRMGCSSVANTPDVKTYGMGDKAQVGPLIYNVFESRWLTQLGEASHPRVPGDRFLLVRLNVVNSGPSEASVPTLSLLDDGGQSYPELSSGEGVPQWLGLLRRIKPADSMQGHILFDVSPKHYRLRIEDDADRERYVLIDIPLRFGSDAPQLPNPGQLPRR